VNIEEFAADMGQQLASMIRPVPNNPLNRPFWFGRCERGYRNRRVVAVQILRGHYIRGEQLAQRYQGSRFRTDPARQGRGLQLDTLARINLGLG
jgi:hypothetical protein